MFLNIKWMFLHTNLNNSIIKFMLQNPPKKHEQVVNRIDIIHATIDLTNHQKVPAKHLFSLSLKGIFSIGTLIGNLYSHQDVEVVDTPMLIPSTITLVYFINIVPVIMIKISGMDLKAFPQPHERHAPQVVANCQNLKQYAHDL